MFYLFLIYFVLSEIEDINLPYDDLSDTKMQTSQSPIPEPESEIDEPDSPVALYILLAVIAVFFVLSVIAYYTGSFQIKSKMTYFQQTLNKYLQQNIHTDKIQFMQYGVHNFDTFIKSYQKFVHGCIVEVEMCLQIDIFHRIKYLFTKQIDKVSFEFLLHPSKPISAMIHVSKEAPFFNRDFDLVEMDLTGDYKYYTDIKGYDKKIMTDIQTFIEKRPDLVDFIEMSDANRFRARDKVGYVVKISFNVTDFEKNIDMMVLRFCFDLAATFSALSLPDHIIASNKRKRDKLLADAKVRIEKMRQFQEAQKIFKETGIFPTPEELEKMKQEQKQKQESQAAAENNPKTNEENDDDVYFEAVPISSLQNEETEKQTTESDNNSNTKIKQD